MGFDENLQNEVSYEKVDRDFQAALSEDLKKMVLPGRRPLWNIFRVVLERSLKEKLSASEYEKRLWDVEAFLKETEDTFWRQLDTNKENATSSCQIWQHQKIDLNMSDNNQLSISGSYGISGGTVSYYNLFQLVEFYLARPWMQSNLLDWMFLDCLIFLEIESFLEMVKAGQVVGKINRAYHLAGGNLEKMTCYQLGWGIGLWLLRYPLPLGITVSLAYLGYEKTFMGMAVVYSVYVISRLFLWPSRFFKQKDLQKELKEVETIGRHMTIIYWYCSPPVVCPRILKEAFEKGREVGAQFGGATYVLLDRIHAKNPSQFLPFCQPIEEL